MQVIFVIALMRYFFIAINHQINLVEAHDGWVNYLYLPAGANVIALLTSGYTGALGVAVGSLAWNILNRNLDIQAEIILSTMPLLSCSISYLIYSSTHRSMDKNYWHAPTLKEYIYFSLIYAIINSSLHHVVFPFLLGSTAFSAVTFAEMLFGDVFGAAVVFITFNILTSLLIDIVKYRRKNM